MALIPGIGIFGGTFDPIHMGHLEISRAVRDHYGLKELHLVPAFKNPLREDHEITTSPVDRLEMIRLAIKGEPGLVCNDIEIERAKHNPGMSYTIETIKEFRSTSPSEPLILIVGADNVAFHNWFLAVEFPEYLEKIAVVSRPGMKSRMDETLNIVKGMYPSIWMLIDYLEIVQNPVSSTLIREELADGVIPENALHPEVEKYIKDRGLYGFRGEPSRS